MNDPFWRLPVVPSFTVTSTDVTDGQALPPAQMSGIFGVSGGEVEFEWAAGLQTLRSGTKGQAEPARIGRGPSSARCGRSPAVSKGRQLRTANGRHLAG